MEKTADLARVTAQVMSYIWVKGVVRLNSQDSGWQLGLGLGNGLGKAFRACVLLSYPPRDQLLWSTDCE